jgi:hypothetical protein
MQKSWAGFSLPVLHAYRREGLMIRRPSFVIFDNEPVDLV